ncbi:acetyltransferase [Paenibacillus sp. FSL R10-2736]|uniref:acetyltransferase n=1 Tax=Paenibacillus sp. FSL R10-2736 TaxID=2954692 RepID=UPI0030F95545
MKEKLIIIGAGGHGKVVADIAKQMNKWKIICFLDDNELLKECLGFEIIGKTSRVNEYIKDFDIFIAIGDNDAREKIQKRLESRNASIPLIIHPHAVLGSEVKIGYGSVIMAGVVINSSTKIGKGCIINTSSSIDHDNNIEDYVHISPGVHLAGNVKIGRQSWLGVGSIVINNIFICKQCKLGAGAVVVKNIVHPGTYVGIPARRRNNEENINTM